MAYSTHTWVTGEAITQEKMNNIRDGIDEALAGLQQLSILDGRLDKIDGGSAFSDTSYSTLADKVSAAKDRADNAYSLAYEAKQDTADGTNAWTQVAGVLTFDENTGDVTKNLATTIGEIRDSAAAGVASAAEAKQWINDAKAIGTILKNGQQVTAGSLAEKITDIDRKIADVVSTATSTANILTPVDGSRDYQTRLTDIDANTKPEINLPTLITEIKTARGTNSSGGANTALSQRFAQDEAIINQHTTDISQRVTYSDVKNNFTSSDTDKPLSAAKGKELKDMIGGNYSSSNTVASAINQAEQNAETYANTNKVDKQDIYNGVDHTANDQKVLDARVGKTLADRIDAIDNSSTGTVHGLDVRVTALETEVDMTSANSRIDEALSRLDAIDDSSTGSIAGLDSRLTTAENDIDTIETAIGNSGLAGRVSTLETAVGDTSTGLTGRVGTLETDVNDTTTGLAATKAIADAAKATADAAATASDLTTLAGRVTDLENEPKSATVIVDSDCITYDTNTGDPTIYTTSAKTTTVTPTEDADYLLQGADDKYYYWKYIGTAPNGDWELISGGGSGNGSSSGEFAESLSAITTPDENTDYFVGNNTIGYTHYRYIPSEVEGEEGTFVRILPKGLLIGAGVTANGGLEAYTVEDNSTNVFGNFVAFKDVEANPVKENEVVVSTNIIFTDTNGQTHTVNVQGGGGAGGGSSYTVRLKNALSSLKVTAPKKEGYNTILRAKVEVKDAGVIDTEFDQSHTINAIVQYSQNQNGPWTNFTTIPITNNTEFNVNVNSILSLGNKTYVRITAVTTIDDEEKTSSLTYEVTQVEMSIAAVNFNQATVRSTNFNFSYRCIGSGLTKQVHFKIDGSDITGSPVTTTLHNDIAQQTIPLTGLAVGMHSFQVYFTVDGIESNILNYYIIYNNDSTRQAPIIALAAESSTITYGDDLKINYTVATAGTETTDSVVLELYAIEDSAEVVYSSTTLENVINERVDTWRPVDYPEIGTAYVRATATHTVNNVDYTDTKTIQITINELDTDYELEPAGVANLVYSYNAYGRTNNDAGKEVYHYDYDALTGETIEWTGAFNGFNWSGDGYVDGQTLTISGGATHTVNVPIFQNKYNDILLEDSQGVNDITEHGRTVEIEYEVASATDLNDVIIDYMANVTTTTSNGVIQKGGVGFQVTPQSCYLLKNGSTVNTDSTGFILNESDIAASYLTPGMRIHLAFVIEPWSDTVAYDGSYHQSVNIYVNGEFANACPYVQGTDSFASPATLRIGSSSCIIKLYQIKMYNRGLTHKEILQNYKMAPAATHDKLVRFEDNDILNEGGFVDYEKARTKYTCLLLTGPEPVYTTTTGGETVLSNPTVSPYKGYPSPAGRKDKKTGEAVGKTESGVTLTKANPNNPLGYDIEFDLRSTIPTDQSIEVPAYIGARGAYASSNNVQGTSSQKYPVHNLKVYLAKWNNPKTTVTETEVQDGQEIPQGAETITRTYKHVPHEDDEGYDLVEVEEGEDTTGLTTETKTFIVTSTTTPGEIKKVKYSLKGKDEHGDDIGAAESTLCWKADYMSTDHANTFNANIADGLFSDTLPGASWGAKHQNVVYGIRCLLFQKQGSQPYEFLGDGCLNNDKGNNKTYDLERDGDEDTDTASQKWEFTNNSDDLGYFKTDTIFRTIGEGANAHIQAKDAFESTYPDEGDLKDAGLEPNYNHLQVLLTWLSKRANYWDETNPTARAAKKQIFIDEFEDHINLNHALTYYLFSEYIALCDNRVKNMFLRSDNIRSEVIKNHNGDTILSGNNTPDPLWSNYVNTSTGVTDETYIDWENSTFAVWAPVLYDLDSCFGVENVGYIRVRYDANWDYTWNGAPQFNGYESRLWLQFADCFDNEIKATALSLYNRADGLNYTNFYRQQITGNLDNISPALSNQDMLVKFDKPWSEGFINYSLAEPAMETPYYKYLQRGSRTAQKTAFMSMRSKLLSSKYGASEFTNDSIKFRTGVPVGQNDLQDTKITVVANQVMYPGVAYGDNKEPTRATANGGKVNAGDACEITAGSPVQGNDGIFICGASILTDIGDLSMFRPYQIDVGAGVNLKRLIVGSNAAGYTNGNTDNFQNLNKCVLLEEVNVQNCSNVSTLDLSNNPLIKKVYAAGSGTTTLIFPNGGVLNTVEYSAVTGNITILNQKNFTNFSYEGSETNNYSSLTKLWIENTPNVPIVDIINKSLSHLTAGVRLVGLDIDLYDGASTQEEIDAALETTTLFLNTLVSDLAKGKYLDSAGAFTPGNTQRPYISGKVHVTSIRNSLLAKLNEYYPNLIVYNAIDSNGVVSNNIITEYTIEYRNYDGTLLYTDYRTGREHFIDPASEDPRDIDPITGKNRLWAICPPDGIPKKPEDAQYQYTFGTYESDQYVRYSGWVKQYTTTNPVDDDYPQGNTVFIAYYPTTVTQRYTVNWYEDPAGTAIKSYTANYGIDISGYTQPEEDSSVRRVITQDNKVKVFKGWDKPVGKLTGNLNVYALWEESTIDNGVQLEDIVMENLTAADLKAIALLGPEAKQRILEDKLGNSPIQIQMGKDFYYTSGVNTYDLLNGASKYVFNSSTTDAKIFDGAHGALPEIRPLSVNSDWTLAIDYKFLLTAALYSGSPEYVLASCYNNADSTIQGFKLSLVRNNVTNSTEQYIRLIWGTTNVTLDYLTIDPSAANAKQYCRSYRNMLVLRHRAAFPTELQVFYTAPNLVMTDIPYGSNFSTASTKTTLTWSNNSTLNAPLILGGQYENASAANPVIDETRNGKPAKGIIYWAKFWDKDLGEKNCQALAEWTHETIPFFLSGYDDNKDSTSRQILPGTNLSFVAAQAIGDRYAYPYRNGMSTTNNLAGWRESDARLICNNRIYKGMSTAYQSILLSTGVSSVAVDVSDNSPESVQVITTADYLYLPAEGEVSGDTYSHNSKGDEINSELKWPRPWPWMKTSNIHNLYGFAGSTSILELQTASGIEPFLYRFIGNYIKPTARIFNINQDPYNNGNTWTYNNNQISVQSGDVWINNDIAYIYYTNAEINEGIYVDIPTAGGGWKKADIWHLRTYNTSVNFANENQFEKIEDNGRIITSMGNQYRRTEGRILCPEFSI